MLDAVEFDRVPGQFTQGLGLTAISNGSVHMIVGATVFPSKAPDEYPLHMTYPCFSAREILQAGF